MSASSTSKLSLVEASFPVNDDLERGQPENEVPAGSNPDGPKDASRILVGICVNSSVFNRLTLTQ